MLGFITLFIAIAIIAALASNAGSANRLNDQVEKTKQRETEAKRIKALRDEFGHSILQGWQHITPAKVNDIPSFVAIAENGLLLRIVSYNRSDEMFSTTDDKTITAKSILSSDIVVPEREKMVTRVDRVPVAIKESRSPVGRALVGGVLLGPAGAIVGAASGMSGKTKIEQRAMQRNETVTVKGASKLVLGLQNLITPVLRIEFEPSSLSNEWWYRIQSARSLL